MIIHRVSKKRPTFGLL